MTEAAQTEVVDQPRTLRTTTLAEQGNNLPIGFKQADGSYLRAFTIRPWRMKEEKALTKAMKDDASVAHYVSTVIAFMTEKVGHHDFTAMKTEERKIIISQMFLGDVWFLYTAIRRDALGKELKLNLGCPRCKEEYPFTADLDTLIVKAAESEEDATWLYEVQNPLNLRKVDVKSFQMGPQRWSMTEKVFGDVDAGMAKETAIRSSVRGFNEDAPSPIGVTLMDGELDEMTKLDLERLTAQIDEHYVGPEMALDLTEKNPCTHCNLATPRRLPIDWSYGSFFGSSSR